MLCLTRIFDFCASHRLARPEWSQEKNAEVFGKCANPRGHGHNYRLEVTVTGPLHPETQMILDARKIDEVVNSLVFNDLDHHDLNSDVVWLEGKLPSTEVLADAIWERLVEPIARTGTGIELYEVKLWETRRIVATRRK